MFTQHSISIAGAYVSETEIEIALGSDLTFPVKMKVSERQIKQLRSFLKSIPEQPITLDADPLSSCFTIREAII